ncbi:MULTISPECIES: ammonium transporter AmtB [Enterobacterales]|uniref:ammonium transporter AmtB n=1 Tax=Enterobacterales TaxID=91347 RepID=UPI000847DBD0|nr:MULTISPECIES: ammonium transporter AmtB [Enterobacterales]WOO50526.1 ammonium transporter AmtB [Hafnia alvei]MCT6517898.1 ammonium transporter AmtB [Proteus vulgaris]ODQ06122.1 ammonium transporter [Shigella sp. FC130]OEI93634.1 ammonium transporter [Shigella sp. FC1655]WPF04994.1 ammonium transporter AmtB [Proteus vulgaris]
MKRLLSLLLMLVLTHFSSSVFATETTIADKADNGFMLICTALVFFMSIPGIALFYGGLLRGKNVLSLITQVMMIFSVVIILWVTFGYSLAFTAGNKIWGGWSLTFLNNVSLDSLAGSMNQYIHIAFQGSFAVITVALIIGALGERIRFSALLIFTIIWFTFSYIPIAHMVWGEGGWLIDDGALDFAGGTVVHINAAIAALVGAYLLGKRRDSQHTALKPHNLPMVFTGTAVLYIGWFGFNAGSAGSANAIAALAFLNTVIATAGAVLSWTASEWLTRGKPSMLGSCSGCIAGLVAITPAAGTVGMMGALFIGVMGGIIGLWGVVVLKRWLKADDVCDVFGIHGTCGIAGCLLTGIFTASFLGGVGYSDGMTLSKQVVIQLISVVITVIWSGVVAYTSFKIADKLVGLRVTEEEEHDGLDLTTHGERAYQQ